MKTEDENNPQDNHNHHNHSSNSDLLGSYGTANPPKFENHPLAHNIFRVPEIDYCDPFTADGYARSFDEGVRPRIDHRLLSEDQRKRFIAAFQQLINSGFYGTFVDIHSNHLHRMHGQTGIGGARFGPWHRVYLRKLELALQTVDPSVMLPYWNWSLDRQFPYWLSDYLPTVSIRNGPHTVTRMPGILTPELPTANQVNEVIGKADYPSFTQRLEQIHNTTHVWIGGSMGSVPTAPCDPVFWLHHAEVDRIWSLWQQKLPAVMPPLNGVDAIMDPWTESTADVNDTRKYGYFYA